MMYVNLEKEVKMWKEFKEFALRGSVLDLAVGVIIGAAFGKIVTSLVNDVIMPPIGLLLGKVNFSEFYINLSKTVYPSLAAAREAGAPVIAYGAFINEVINFLIVAFVLFLIIRQFNRVKRITEKPQAPAVPTTKECPYCYSTVPIKATRCPHCTSDL